MKKLLFFIPLFLNAEILSDLKQQEINYDRLKSLANSREVKKSWINPIMVQYLINKDNSQDIWTTTKQFSITVNQPIFKSGAIYYSIKYAKKLKSYNLKQIEIQKRLLIKQALDLAFDYKINELNKKVLFFQIENAKINVKRKKEAFLSGTGDSSDLDNAILNLNDLKLSLCDLKISQNDLKYSFSTISDLDIRDVKLPVFKILKEDEFLKNHLELISKKEYKKVAFYLYKMQTGNQLLSISLNLGYTHKSIQNDFSSAKKSYYNYGITFSVPIDINSKDKIEQKKIEFLKASLEIKDKKRELINSLRKTLKNIKLLSQKKKIYDENYKVYENLIKSTKEAINAGSATYYDLEILENSKKALVFKKRIVDLKIQKLLFNLYYLQTSFLDKM